ncbi:antibiotic biosynthesis monooxygenase [Luteolibacter pohnpeiensis]|uniref:Antibiotic biosynthesis monooxygenase n=1 Tax=Luteolibacter pohnpeiensis TaxID=454153 RepID=A0A934S8A7_9BACT|nr:antibiotic biosynthesis monooxygenase [Luteolibacter pohnpeiensis]MBK1884591.1 antibiotic biosynthesis monooxygenase [Luteolibacter pohnpeiensis]
MILEVAILDVKPGEEAAFERDFSDASSYISSVSGYICHELHRCVEDQSRYVLLAHWETLEAHTEGFRQSPQYSEWKRLLHHYYDPFPTVEHYSLVLKNKAILPVQTRPTNRPV